MASHSVNGYVEITFNDGFKKIVRLNDFGTPTNQGAGVDTLVGSHGKIKEIQQLVYMPT